MTNLEKRSAILMEQVAMDLELSYAPFLRIVCDAIPRATAVVLTEVLGRLNQTIAELHELSIEIQGEKQND